MTRCRTPTGVRWEICALRRWDPVKARLSIVRLTDSQTITGRYALLYMVRY
jgi:hypothetical protein